MFRTHSHDSPAWKHSSRSISYSFPSSCTGTPHSESWYSTYLGFDGFAQEHLVLPSLQTFTMPSG